MDCLGLPPPTCLAHPISTTLKGKGVRSLSGRAPDPFPMTLAALCQQVAARIGLTEREIATASLCREVLCAQAIVSHVAVRHHGLALTTVARQLGVSSQSIARAVLRGPAVLAKRTWTETDFLLG
jgi:hypothetical protein